MPEMEITHERVTTPEGRPNTLKPLMVRMILTWEGSMSSSTAALWGLCAYGSRPNLAA